MLLRVIWLVWVHHLSCITCIDKDNKKPSCRETTGLGGGHASHAYSLGHSCTKGAHASRYLLTGETFTATEGANSASLMITININAPPTQTTTNSTITTTPNTYPVIGPYDYNIEINDYT